jgi:hypothetical protein
MSESPPFPDASLERFVFVTREETSKDFDKKNETGLNSTLSQIGKLHAINLVILVNSRDFAMLPRYESFALMKNSLDLLISALHMARQRAVLETFTLLRVALESGSTALHIWHCANAYEQYKNGDYKSTCAISFAKKAISIVGELWGSFSNIAVHITRDGFGPKTKKGPNDGLKESITFEFDIREHLPLQDTLLLKYISLVSAILLKFYESIVLEPNELKMGWLRLAGTQMHYFNNTDKEILMYYNDIHSLILPQEASSEMDIEDREKKRPA